MQVIQTATVVWVGVASDDDLALRLQHYFVVIVAVAVAVHKVATRRINRRLDDLLHWHVHWQCFNFHLL